MHIREFGKLDFNMKSYRKEYIKFLNENVTCFIAISEAIKQYWINQGISNKKINTIYDYAYWIYSNDVYYASYGEGSNPAAVYTDKGFWMQSSDADWIFKNKSGICCTVAAGGVYALVGDYEESGLIYLLT